ncbi:hypothetical protein LWI28_014497 [Acer negundo]|uniref:Uncharacterized protein n=1 Tax=Acer negundo TaxID=4023 RepID=A0AAD5JHW9_ACENE|nr:hypothetical protein LWI28_014497 [Acer negundo]
MAGDLGPIETDYKRLRMSFTMADQTCILQGLYRSELAPMSNKELSQLTGNILFLHMGTAAPIQVPPSEKIPADLLAILAEFSSIFEEPTQLPPSRHHDHRIPLLPDQPPVNPNLLLTEGLESGYGPFKVSRSVAVPGPGLDPDFANPKNFISGQRVKDQDDVVL